MINRTLICSLVMVHLLFVGGCSSSDEPDDKTTTTKTELTLSEKIESIDTYVSQLHAQELFNGAVLLAKAGEPLLMEVYGYTDASKEQLLTVNSSFRLASVSKQFTTMAIMILQERGLLNYSDLISVHIPELDYPGVTVEHLMLHTSGIQDYIGFPESYITEQGAAFMTMPVFFDILKLHPLKAEFSPGTAWEYSNTGYILLAEVVARVSGISFEEFIHQEISVPLEMADTGVWNLLTNPDSDRLPNRTTGISGGQNVSMTYFDGIAGDGALFSSISDMLKWDRALANNRLVSAETKQRAFTPGILSDGTATGYGYGWGIETLGEQKVVAHSGSWLGARAYIRRNLATGSVMVVLDSSRTTELGEIVDKISSTLADEAF